VHRTAGVRPLIGDLLAHLVGQPAALVYAAIAVLSFLENWLPPLPADTAIALGAFISHKSDITALGVFLATWIPNVAGAMSVWAVARTHGRRFFASPLGHRLFSQKALGFVEMEFRRYGWLGLFIVKLLPGVRAIAAPFAGVADVTFLHALLPMAAASAVWYGGVTLLGAYLGSEWETVQRWLGEANRLLAVVGAAAVLAAVVLVLRRRRAARHGARRHETPPDA
jgi:membrane protein DedA with SNARE-associated domain